MKYVVFLKKILKEITLLDVFAIKN